MVKSSRWRPNDRGLRQQEQMTRVNAKLQITPGHWYSWQMLPGFGQPPVPYCSPIWVKDVMPRKTGKGILRLGFFNALYAEGVQDFTLDLRILKHEASYLVSEPLYGEDGPSDRTAIIGRIGFAWIQHFCPSTWAARPPSSFRDIEQGSVSHYLNALFGPMTGGN
jgi:hypothetical protein